MLQWKLKAIDVDVDVDVTYGWPELPWWLPWGRTAPGSANCTLASQEEDLWASALFPIRALCHSAVKALHWRKEHNAFFTLTSTPSMVSHRKDRITTQVQGLKSLLTDCVYLLIPLPSPLNKNVMDITEAA